MYLVSIHLQNFRQHKDTYIQFVQGLTGILGDNGSGKSTILEAIAWAFYGNKGGILRGNKDTLVWRNAPGRAEVIVDLKFIFQGRNYHIQRVNSNSSHIAQLWQEDIVIANSARAVDEKIGELLSMDSKEFFNSYFTGQKELQFLGSIDGATARERFIAKMLGYEKIEDCQGRADKVDTLRYDLKRKEEMKHKLDGFIQSFEGINDRISNQEAVIQTITQQGAVVQNKLIEVSNEKDKIEPQWQQINEQHIHFLRLQTELTAYQSQQKKLAQEVTGLEERVAATAKNLDRFYELQSETSSYESLQTEYQTLTQNYQAFLKIKQTEAQCTKLEEEITAIAQELEVLKSIEVGLLAITSTIEDCQSSLKAVEEQIQLEISNWNHNKADLQAKIRLEEQVIKDVQEQHKTIVEAGEDGVCPTCARPLCEEYEKVVNGFLEEIINSQQQLSQWQAELKERSIKPLVILEAEQNRSGLQMDLQKQEVKKQGLLREKLRLELQQKQLNAKEGELAKLRLQISQQSREFNTEYYQEIQAQVNLLRPKYEAFLRMAQIPSTFQLLQDQLQQKQQENIALLREVARIQEEIDRLGFNELEFRAIEQKLQKIKASYDTTKEEHRQRTQALDYEQQKLQSLQQQYQEFVTKKNELKAIGVEYLTLKELDQAFSMLRQYLTEQIRPQLAENASLFLSQLTEGRYNCLQIDNKYQVIVQDQGRDRPVISGGEEDIVNLSLRLAISQMITERRGQPFSLLILDEVFGSLDQGHRDNVVQLLHRLEERFEQVLIITHIEDIKESLNQTIRLAFDPVKQHTIVLQE